MNSNRIGQLSAIVFAMWFFLAIEQPVFSALIISDSSSSYTIDFDNTVTGVNEGAYTGAGFSPSPTAGQLDSSAWATKGMDPEIGGDSDFEGTYIDADTAFTRGPSAGGVTFPGFYGFDVSNGGSVNRALGIQPAGGGSWDPGSVTLRIQNTSGQEITEFEVSYLVYMLNNAPRAHSFNFSYSEDNSTYDPVGDIDFASPLAGATDNPWVSTPRSTVLSGLSIPHNGYYYLRWSGQSVAGNGLYDELALDDVVLNNIVATMPEPSAVALAGLAVLGLAGFARRRKSKYTRVG